MQVSVPSAPLSRSVPEVRSFTMKGATAVVLAAVAIANTNAVSTDPVCEEEQQCMDTTINITRDLFCSAENACDGAAVFLAQPNVSAGVFCNATESCRSIDIFGNINVSCTEEACQQLFVDGVDQPIASEAIVITCNGGSCMLHFHLLNSSLIL